MISLWPHWQRPLFLILLPVFIWLLWKIWYIHTIKGSWQTIIPTPFQPWLLKGTSVQESITSKLILSLASLLAFLALLGPSWKHIEQPPLKIDAPLVIVLDLTPNMLSRDIPPSRLESAKHKILDIIKARKDAQTAIVVYSGSAHALVPLSDDQATIGNLLNSITPTIMPRIGQRADLGIKKALKLLNNTQQRAYGQILLITTGLSNNEQTAINKLLTNQTITLSILGVGTAQGAPIITPSGEFLKDNNNQIILPKLDTTALQNFAYDNGGYYSNITLNNNDIKLLKLDSIKGGERYIKDTEQMTTDYWQDQGYWLILPLLLLAALAGRKGWLCCIPLLLAIQIQPTHAFEWNQLWLNKNQQGQQLLKENNPKEAAKRFNDPKWQGYASYQAKDYQQAEKLFSQANTPEELYNYANTLAKQGKYKEAIAAWDKAIADKPNFKQAIKNKKMVEDLLKQQQQNQSSKKDQQEKKNQSDKNNQDENNRNSSSSANHEKQQQNQQQNNEANHPRQPNGQQQQSQSEQQADNDKKQDKNQSNPADNKDKKAQQDDKAQASPKQSSDNQQDTKQSGQMQPSSDDINAQEQQDSLQQWIRTIPDDPSELLRRKFYYEQRYNRGDN